MIFLRCASFTLLTTQCIKFSSRIYSHEIKKSLQNRRAAYEIFSLIDCECAAFFSFFSLRLNQQSCIWTAKDNQRYCFNGDCYVFVSRSERTTICFQRDKLCHFNYNWSSVNKKSEICDNFHETNKLLLTVCWVCS